MRKILITGGAGFIGSNFIRYILGKYDDLSVVNLDKLTYCGNPENLRDFENNPRYTFIKGDISDPTCVAGAMNGCEKIVNFAAESHVDRSIEDPAEFIRTNVYGTMVLLEAARRLGVSKFLHISTDEVYGSIKEGTFTEESSLAPSSPYSASKAGADLLALSYYKTYGFPVLITRSSNNFGPYQYPEKLISLFITNALDDKPLPVYAQGKNIRDWLFVADNCSAIDCVLHNGKPGEIYNIGGSREVRNIEITRSILNMLGKKEGLIRFVKDRPGHDWRYSISSDKVRSLGWEPAQDFDSALSVTVDWYRENRNWWKPLKDKKA